MLNFNLFKNKPINMLREWYGNLLPFGLVKRKSHEGEHHRDLANYYLARLRHNAMTLSSHGHKVLFAESDRIEALSLRGREYKYYRMLKALVTKEVIERKKVRMGSPDRDGGYVMVEPKNTEKTAYSFGVGNKATWDTDMVKRGFTVYQYDGTIDGPVVEHEKIRFFKHNITGSSSPAPNEKNIGSIISDNEHWQENDIILQIDIEGSEWHFFDTISVENLLKFSQIIVEFHSLITAPEKHPDNFDYILNILEKLAKTHQPVHCHANNWGELLAFPLFSIPDTLEVTYLRKNDNQFKIDTIEYPTPLDSSNNFELPDIYLGNIGVLVYNWEKRNNVMDLSCEATASAKTS